MEAPQRLFGIPELTGDKGKGSLVVGHQSGQGRLSQLAASNSVAMSAIGRFKFSSSGNSEAHQLIDEAGRLVGKKHITVQLLSK
jgi:hypothetical protein